MSQRKSREEMFSLVSEWSSGNETQREFCRSRGLRPSTFSDWHKKYKEAQDQDTYGFTEIKPELQSTIEICYPNGVKVHFPEGDRSLATIQALVRLF